MEAEGLGDWEAFGKYWVGGLVCCERWDGGDWRDGLELGVGWEGGCWWRGEVR